MTDTPIHVFLSHGLESGPGSTKIQAMKAESETFPGIQAHAIDHSSTRDPATRLAQMREAMAECNAKPENTILAGSSMGGWVCAQTSSETPVLGCFMLAPALAMARYPQSSPLIQADHRQIIHGWDDDVVPVAPVLDLARDQGLPILVPRNPGRPDFWSCRMGTDWKTVLIGSSVNSANSFKPAFQI